jgi:hypothetical protein
MFVKMKEEQLMLKHSTGWHIWEGGCQEDPFQDHHPTSSGSEEEGSDQTTPDEEEEEEIMDPTIHGEEEADPREGEKDKEKGNNDSVPAFTVIRDGKTKLRKEISNTLGIKLYSVEMTEFFRLFPMPGLAARDFMTVMAQKLGQFHSELSHAIQGSPEATMEYVKQMTGLRLDLARGACGWLSLKQERGRRPPCTSTLKP